jgi:putative membrane protein
MKVLTLIFLFFLATSSCYYPRGGHMMDDWGHMTWGYGGVFMWLILLILIGVVLYLVFRGDRWVRRGGEETPLDILKKRYARGEITKAEYDRMKKELA